jgi:hypothetical protein
MKTPRLTPRGSVKKENLEVSRNSFITAANRGCKPFAGLFLVTPYIAEAIAAFAILGVALAVLA